MKKTIAIILALVMIVGCLAGCGSKKDEKTIKIGASPTPHAEILAVVKDVLAEQGYTLEIVEYNDFVLPNTAVEDGSLDANYFQHKPYLDDFNANNGTNIVSVGAIHYEPFGIYSNSLTSLDQLPDGAKIAIPNDGSNESRALFVLQQEGLITLKEGTSVSSATILDIESNPRNFEFFEMEAAQLVLALPDVDIAVINGNYAIGGGLKVADALALEDASGNAAQTYANIIAVKAGNEGSEKIVALVNALMSDEVAAFMEATYGGAVVPIF